MTDFESDEGTAVRGDRFSGGPARGFLSSLDADERIFAADVAVDRAHVVMLAEQGIIDDETAGTILQALNVVEVEGHTALPDGEDVHEAIESAVIEQVGPEGGKMHTARSRNDEVATCIRLRLREDVLEAIEAVCDLRAALVAGATEHADTVMPGFTHLQHAQPTTVGHYLLSYEQALARDTARLFDAFGRINQNPLGAAAFAGTPFDVDRDRTAELLGFDSVLTNSMDASSARDFLVEVASAMANLATTLSGLSEDVVIFANQGYLDLSDDYSSTSSIMPQKKNPDTFELVRSVAGEANSGLMGILTTLKGLPRAYNRDLQNATPHVWDSVDTVTQAVGVAAGGIATATWNEDDLADAAGSNFSTATGVADLLAMEGVPFRTAHELVAKAGETGADYAALDAAAEDVLGESLDTYVDKDAVEAALDPAESVAMRDSAGGPAPDAVAAALDEAEATLTADTDELEAKRGALDDAHTALMAEVNEYV
ncbi:argininosuccinate lyase [Haloarchaeobius sp. HME9146]|uniref:argininosuccinate lyase n=1 Tax=Haloarchaeobius sp. HME9146 TaxID=2978732 RepID=UPI0021BE0E4A|nr:argininosuccinate lyase [Haloarchaeobius sp. HME9146]MCT9094931.1 argininosuccinate lyase [Haloarchaeobius sp. HME9146]